MVKFFCEHQPFQNWADRNLAVKGNSLTWFTSRISSTKSGIASWCSGSKNCNHYTMMYCVATFIKRTGNICSSTKTNSLNSLKYRYFIKLNLYIKVLNTKTSLLRRLQAQALPNAASPIGKVNPFSQIAVTLELVMRF